MVLAGGTLFVAGPPDLLDEEAAVKGHWNPDIERDLANQDAAMLGRRGATLWAVSAEDGKRLDEIKLEFPPTWDGMAAARGRLLISTVDGTIHCFVGK
jgi:hypothetical protein